MAISKKERQAFDKLYKYVKDEVFHYEPNVPLPQQIVLGLKGLSHGKAIENKNIPDRGNISFEVIYLTFVFCKSKIDYAMTHKDFKSDISAFVYIRKIVEPHLNEMAKKYNDAKTSGKVKEVELKKKSTRKINDETYEGYVAKGKIKNFNEEMW